MATPEQAMEAFEELTETYREFLQLAADALAPETPQEDRDALRRVLQSFIND